MNVPVVFSSEAEDDLSNVEFYLAERFSSRNAAQYVQRIIAACKAIGLAPLRGYANRTRLGVRTIGFEKQVNITFAIKHDRVEILGIYYRGRTPR